MKRAQYVEIDCQSAVNRVQGMPFQWSLNPYRGCVHACHYCYARATHTYYGLNADEDFETQIFVKARPLPRSVTSASHCTIKRRSRPNGMPPSGSSSTRPES